MSDDWQFGQGICQREEYRNPSSGIRLWESMHPREKSESVNHRHRNARILCRRCPLLDACEKYLTQCELAGASVDGVVAGRYCDVRVWGSVARYQSHCEGCGCPLIPREPGTRAAFGEGARRHAGEGLCKKCFPLLRRKR